MNYIRKFSLIIASIALLTACSGGGGGGGNDDSSDDSGDTNRTPAIFSIGETTDSNGRATVSFSIPSETTKFSIVAEVASAFTRFTSITSDDGTEHLTPGGEQISLSNEFSPSVNTASVPSRDFDPKVDGEKTYTATVEVASSESGRTPAAEKSLTFTVNTKADSDLRNGRLSVNIFLVGELAQTDAIRAVIDSALEEMIAIYRDEAKITVDITKLDVDGPSSLPSPFLGSAFYLAAASGAPSPAVNIFVGSDIEDGDGSILGISASIPGPPNPTLLSAVAVSLIAGAGPDGVYSSENVRTLGETFAHEAGHFIGLFHPVELIGLSVIGNDPLTDTDLCSSTTECLSNSDLIHNLMFPTPVLDSSGLLVRQNQLSSQQRSVLNQYIAVD